MGRKRPSPTKQEHEDSSNDERVQEETEDEDTTRDEDESYNIEEEEEDVEEEEEDVEEEEADDNEEAAADEEEIADDEEEEEDDDDEEILEDDARHFLDLEAEEVEVGRSETDESDPEENIIFQGGTSTGSRGTSSSRPKSPSTPPRRNRAVKRSRIKSQSDSSSDSDHPVKKMKKGTSSKDNKNADEPSNGHCDAESESPHMVSYQISTKLLERTVQSSSVDEDLTNNNGNESALEQEAEFYIETSQTIESSDVGEQEGRSSQNDNATDGSQQSEPASYSPDVVDRAVRIFNSQKDRFDLPFQSLADLEQAKDYCMSRLMKLCGSIKFTENIPSRSCAAEYSSVRNNHISENGSNGLTNGNKSSTDTNVDDDDDDDDDDEEDDDFDDDYEEMS